MPKRLRPAVDLMAFKCRTLKVKKACGERAIDNNNDDDDNNNNNNNNNNNIYLLLKFMHCEFRYCIIDNSFR
jgi:hypothetical protein